MPSARSSSTEAARERRRQKGDAQAVPLPLSNPAAASEEEAITMASAKGMQQAATTNEPSELTFDDMIKRELDHAMDLEIKEALNKISKRQTALMAQESSVIDVVKDELGHDSDFYEDLVLAVQNKDPRVGDTKEEIYQFLADLEFTRMRPLEALHEMYPVAQQQVQEEEEQQQPILLPEPESQPESQPQPQPQAEQVQD